jgi:type I restriction enzyme S subunit
MNKVQLGDIAEINRETFSINDFDEILYLDTSSVTKGVFDNFLRFSKNDAIPSRAKRAIKDKTIVYSTVRPNLQHFGIFENPQENIVVSTGFATIDVKDDLVNPKYLYYNLTQDNYTNALHTIATNNVSSYPSINPSDLENLELEIQEDIQTQTAIARVLSSFDDKIELNNKINKELEAMAKQLYDYWFVQFDFPNEKGKPYKSSGGKMIYNETLKNNIPKDWEVNKLEFLTSFNRGISYKSADINGENGIPMINLGSIDINRNYRTGQLKYYSGKYNKEDIVKKGDMLIACTDLTRNCDIIGSPIIVPEEYDKYLYSMDLAKINIFNETSDMFIYESLRTDTYHNYIKYFASGTNVLHLNLNGISWYEIAIPPIKIQEKFSVIIKSIRNKQLKIISENQILVQLRDFLLPLLMNGQVTVKAIESKTDIISFKNQDNNDQKFDMWFQSKKTAARGEADLQTLREIFDAMDDDDK